MKTHRKKKEKKVGNKENYPSNTSYPSSNVSYSSIWPDTDFKKHRYTEKRFCNSF